MAFVQSICIIPRIKILKRNYIAVAEVMGWMERSALIYTLDFEIIKTNSFEHVENSIL